MGRTYFLLPVILKQAFLRTDVFFPARIFAACLFVTSIPAARIYCFLYFLQQAFLQHVFFTAYIFIANVHVARIFTRRRQCWIAQQLVQSQPVAFLLTIVCVHADSTGLHIWAASIHSRERSVDQILRQWFYAARIFTAVTFVASIHVARILCCPYICCLLFCSKHSCSTYF